MIAYLINTFTWRFKLSFIVLGLMSCGVAIHSIVDGISENSAFKKSGKIAMVDTIDDITRSGSNLTLKFRTADGNEVRSTLATTTEIDAKLKEALYFEIEYLVDTPTHVRVAGQAKEIKGPFVQMLLGIILLALGWRLRTPNNVSYT